MLDLMREVLQGNDLCVLATQGEDGPHCSLMAYLYEEEASSLYLFTSKQTQKFKNLLAHPQVGLLIDDREKHSPSRRDAVRSLIVKGEASAVGDSRGKAGILQLFAQERPHLEPILADPQAALVAVRITSLQLLDGVKESHFYKIS